MKTLCIPFNRAATLAAIIPTLIYGVQVSAQTTERRIEEVVVSAERREASIQDTSISITALTAEDLENFGIRLSLIHI